MYVEPCTKEQLKDIYGEFGTTDETIQRDVKAIMEWLEKQPHLPNIKDEEFLRLFYLRCKTSLEQTKLKLERYCMTKARALDLFVKRDPKENDFKKTYNLMPVFFAPKLTPEGNRVIFYLAMNVPKDELPNPKEYLKNLLTMALLANAACPNFKKVISVIDMRQATLRHITMHMIVVDKFLPLIMKHIPLRFEKIYFLHNSAAVDPMIALARRLSKVIQEKLVVWKRDPKELAEEICKDVLPSEYGGTVGSFEDMSKKWKSEIEKESWREWLQKEEKWVADLSKKPVDRELKYDVGDYGLEGSFRQISID